MSNFREFADEMAARFGYEPFTIEEARDIDQLAEEIVRDIELYPVVHAWRTNNGSQLTFWCKHCKGLHTHGRHSGDSYAVSRARADAESNWTPRVDAVLPLRLWKRYVRRHASCTYNGKVPGGRGFCTCPMGSGDGHRVAHCWNREPGGYYDHGYVLHEVEPNDARATRKPPRKSRRGIWNS